MGYREDLPFTSTAGGVRIRVKATPKASKNSIEGVERDAAGRPVLKVKVTAVPEGGKANQAVIKLLAKAWRVAKSDLTLVSGETSRMKEFEFTGDPDSLVAWADKTIAKEG